MSKPIVLISHFRIKRGAAEAYRALQREVTSAVHADKPQTLAFLSYLDADAAHMTAIHAFGDEVSMDVHFEGADERSRVAYEFLVPDGWEIYGAPSRRALETIRAAAASSGVGLTLQPELVAGFLRLYRSGDGST